MTQQLKKKLTLSLECTKQKNQEFIGCLNLMIKRNKK